MGTWRQRRAARIQLKKLSIGVKQLGYKIVYSKRLLEIKDKKIKYFYWTNIHETRFTFVKSQINVSLLF